MARNRDEQFRQYQLVQRCLHGDAQARDLLYDLLYRYLHDKLAAYLKKQCPYLSGDDFEDVISLTLAKCLEDLPLFQNRSCLTTWVFGMESILRRIPIAKAALTTAIISIWTHLALCIKPVWIRWLYIFKKNETKLSEKLFRACALLTARFLSGFCSKTILLHRLPALRITSRSRSGSFIILPA